MSIRDCRLPATVHIGAPFLHHGGAEKQLRFLIEVLLEHDIDVILHVISYKSDIDQSWLSGLKNASRVEVHYYDEDVLRIRTRPFHWVKLLYRLWTGMKIAQTVYVYTAYFVPLIPLLKSSGTRVIFSERILSPQTKRRKILYRFVRFADLIVVNGDSLFNYFSLYFKHVRLIRNKVEPVKWSVDHPWITNPTKKLAIISRYDRFKNIPFALDALGDRADIEINVYGSGDRQYKNLIATLAASKRTPIRLHDFRPIEEIYDSNDIILHPSLAEGTSNVVIEAMASRKPILASNIRENLDTGLHAKLFFSPNDMGSLGQSLDEFFNMPLEELREILEYNAQIAASHFGATTFRKEVLRLFEANHTN